MGRFVGPLALAILIGLAIFMLFVVQSPELSARFQRPQGFYDGTLEKTGMALLFAAVVSVIVWLIRRVMK